MRAVRVAGMGTQKKGTCAFWLSTIFCHSRELHIGEVASSSSYTESSACIENRATVCEDLVSILRSTSAMSAISAILYEELQEASGVPVAFQYYSTFFNL